MEDSVGEEERREQEETMAQGKERGGEEDAGGGGDEPGGDSGFLTTVASKIGAAMSGASGSGGAEEEDGNSNVDGNVIVACGGEEEGKRSGDGGGGIFGKLLSTETMAQGKERGGEGVGGSVETDGEGGFLTTVASKIGAAISGSNGSCGAEEQGGERNGDGDVVAASGDQEEGKRDGNSGGGIFSKLMSGSPDSLPASVETEEERTEGGEQAGILSAVASKIGIAMPSANGHASHGNEDDATKIGNGNATDHGKTEEKWDEPNCGGIVKQLISNLPTDDQAPDAEEASLLIAIIDD